MPFTYRDKPKLSDRFRGKSGEELLNELASDLDPQTRMFFDPPPSRRQRHGNPSIFSRGFPFADDRKRTDIRAYLDEIAARHPEFADQLREPPWDEDFNCSPVGRQGRDVDPQGEGNSSQVPGTSSQEPTGEVNEPRQNLSNFGLRNTVPLGPGAVVEEDRQQRSMSAPPDNRPVEKQKRFITKCEIPIMHDPAQESGGPKTDQSAKGGQDNAQSKMNNAPTVRVIPIQVEGRDAPLLNTNFDTTTNYGGDPFEGRLPRDFGAYQRHSPRFAHKERSATPPNQQYAPHYQQYVPPHQHFGPAHHQNVPQQQYVPPQQQQQHQHQPRHPFQHQQPQKPSFAKPQQQQYQQPRPYPPQHHQQQFPHPQQQQYHQSQPHPQQQHSQAHSQQQQQHQQQPQSQPHPQPPSGGQKLGHGDETDSKPPQAPQPKPEPIKDPIEKVHVIQKEVEELMKQVESFNGNSRSDKQYLMLDELLTRQLLLLDNIDTEGKENVRQARKDTIRSIQRCISTLENKVPLVEAQEEGGAGKAEKENGGKSAEEGNASQAMEVDQTKENTPVSNKESQNMEVDSQGGEKEAKESLEKATEGESKEKAQ